MATSQADARDRQFLAVIGDEVSVILQLGLHLSRS